MPRFTVAILVLFFWGCSEPISKDDLHYLNGYWQIVNVEFENGANKEYSLGNTVDFFYLKDNKGYRKKVQPNIVGGFETSNNVVNFKIKEANNDIMLWYENGLSNWSVRLVELKKDSFTIINEERTKYIYKRYKPIILNE
jgi:hypothetical protein